VIPQERTLALIGVAAMIFGLIALGAIVVLLIARYRPREGSVAWLGWGVGAVAILLIAAVGVALVAYGAQGWPPSLSPLAPTPTAWAPRAPLPTKPSRTATPDDTTAAEVSDALPPASPTPEPTATGFIMPLPTATATALPEPTPIPPLVVETADRYRDEVALRSAYSINNAGGASRCALGLAPIPRRTTANEAIAFAYTIRQPSPNDYCGFETWSPPVQNWSGYTQLCVDVVVDGPANELVVQFGEAGGEIWKNWTATASLGRGELCLPLSQPTFTRANWAPRVNDRIDLHAITYYGIYINGPSEASGVVYVRQMRLLGGP
jgi:hypothetical protein